MSGGNDPPDSGRSTAALDGAQKARVLKAARPRTQLDPETDYQPPLVAAAYNAGGLHPPREGDDNPWRLRSTGDHISRFCQFFGDACAVAAEEGWSHVERGS